MDIAYFKPAGLKRLFLQNHEYYYAAAWYSINILDGYKIKFLQAVM